LTGDSGTTQSGYLDIETDSGYEWDIAVSYAYEVRSAGVLLESVGSSQSAGSWKFTFAVEKAAVRNTAFAWCPASRSSTSPFNVMLTLSDSSGAVVRQKTVVFNGHQAQLVDQIFTDLPESFLGYLSIQSDKYIYLEVLRVEQTPTGFQFTWVPPDY
jgi:hypothetical protein